MPATALDLSLVIQKDEKLTSTSIQNEAQKVFQNPRQNGPKCTHVGSKNEAPMGYPIDFWGSFSKFLRFLAVLGCQVRLGRCFGPLLGRSWSRLGAVLGPKMDQLSAKLPPKPNPIGVLRRLEGSLRSVPGASWCVSKQLPALHMKKDEKLRHFWCPGTQ